MAQAKTTNARGTQRGSLEIDVTVRHVGRIKRATGAPRTAQGRQTAKRMREMVRNLAGMGRLDLLTRIRDGELALPVVWSFYRLGELDRLPSGDTMKPFREAFRDWLTATPTGAENARDRGKAERAFKKLARKDDTVEAAPRILEEHRKACVARGTPTAFRQARAAMQAFCRDTLKKNHRLYHAVCAVPLISRDEVPPAPSHYNPQTPQQLQALAAKLTAAGHPHHAAHLWAMALTGMGPGEYWGTWSVQRDRIAIYGTKRVGRHRVVPRLARVPTAPTTQYRAFQKALQAASAGTVEPYDLRRSFSNWMVEAGILVNRREHYMGHGPKTITQLYERPVVELFLREDAARLDRYIDHDLAGQPEQSHDISHDTTAKEAAT